MPPEIRPLPSTSKTSPGRRVSRKAVDSFGVNDSQWLAGFCNRAIKRPALSNIQPMIVPHLLGVFPYGSSRSLCCRSVTQFHPSVIMRDGLDHCTEVDPYVTFG